MTLPSFNPFRPTRWEHHSVAPPLIWFSDTAEQLCAEKSFYVFGNRGSGKTSLLKSICWEDLHRNESLRLQRRLTDFPSLGIYIRFPDHISRSLGWERWHLQNSDESDGEYAYHRFFSLALELVCLERLLEACHALRLDDAAIYAANLETDLVREVLEEFPDIETFSRREIVTFVELARVMRHILRKMNDKPRRAGNGDEGESFLIREPYQLLDFVCSRLVPAVRLRSPDSPRRFGVKFCLDDCEVLSAIQRKSLNTLVRLSRNPISWVVSSVGSAYDDTETFIDNQFLSDADRRVVSLDEPGRRGFASLCQAVAGLRLLFALPTPARKRVPRAMLPKLYDLKKHLGTRDINQMFAILVRNSTSPIAAKVHEAACILGASLGSRRTSDGNGGESGRPDLPYYEAYVALASGGLVDSADRSISSETRLMLARFADRIEDGAFGAWIRRKQAAALLLFARQIKVRRLPLSGQNVVLHLADGSIRDFLEIMADIYDAWLAIKAPSAADGAGAPERFLATEDLGGDVQTRGIYASSKSFVDGMAAKQDIDTEVITRLVNGLGHLTHLLQTTSPDKGGIGSAERGIFVLEVNQKLSADGEEVLKAVRQAELAGYLRPEQEPAKSVRSRGPNKLVCFRLHARFAPHFGFSFRGAYESSRLSVADLSTLCFAVEDVSPDAWARNQVAALPIDGEVQFGLPLREDFS